MHLVLVMPVKDVKTLRKSAKFNDNTNAMIDVTEVYEIELPYQLPILLSFEICVGVLICLTFHAWFVRNVLVIYKKNLQKYFYNLKFANFAKKKKICF